MASTEDQPLHLHSYRQTHQLLPYSQDMIHTIFRRPIWAIMSHILATQGDNVPDGKINSNRLEVLKGVRIGQMSIRINDQWRICFRRVDHDAWDVEVVDYH